MPDKKQMWQNYHPITSDEESLRNLLNTPMRDIVNTEASGPMTVPLPPFGGQPLIVGNELSRLYNYFRRLAPNLDTRTSRIQYGPGNVATERLQDANYDPTKFGLSNLLGTTNWRTGETNLNPSLGGPEWLRHIGMTSIYDNTPPGDILAHELTHIAGHLGESEPEQARKLYRQIMQQKKLR